MGLTRTTDALKGTPCKWLDLAALCRKLLPKHQIHRIRYFTAKVSPRPGNAQQHVRQDAYLRALATLPNVSVHLGEFRVRSVRMALTQPVAGGIKTVEVIKTEEKGSDVNLATYLTLDACQGDCSAAVVISNDSDLREPLRVVRQELGLTTGILNPHPTYKRSRSMEATFFKQIRESALKQCQFPERLTDAQGFMIHKPENW
ncbi:MAG: NYN domain-containing protein [Mycobacteriales bacterium]